LILSKEQFLNIQEFCTWKPDHYLIV
jgi:hypothetical protein